MRAKLEGESAGHQTIVLRFESKEKAKALYHSGEYQAVIGKRHGYVTQVEYLRDRWGSNALGTLLFFVL